MKTKYSILTGLVKTAKNSAVLLVPFLLALIAGVPENYAWITGPIVYLINNWYKNR